MEMKTLKVENSGDIPYCFTGIIEFPNGEKNWLRAGMWHREDGGPAIIFASGTKLWYRDGRCHRAGGPAIEFADGCVEYRINGKQVSKEEVEKSSANQVSKFQKYDIDPEDCDDLFTKEDENGPYFDLDDAIVKVDDGNYYLVKDVDEKIDQLESENVELKKRIAELEEGPRKSTRFGTNERQARKAKAKTNVLPQELKALEKGTLLRISHSFYDCIAKEWIMKAPERKREVVFLGVSKKQTHDLFFRVLYDNREIEVVWHVLYKTLK
jgi:hypothetical protein